MFTHPQDYSHVSLQKPLLANESHIAKQGPTTLTLSSSLVQQSICCLVNLQKQCRAYFPFTMISTEKVLSSPIYFSDILIFPDQCEQCCHQHQTSVLVENWAHTNQSDVKYSNYIWYQESRKFVISRLDSAIITYCLSTCAHKESHEHQ